MPKNFEFMMAQPHEFSSESLRQGDVLERNEVLSTKIQQGHSHYATAPDYEYFMVLTPSCDLELRNGKCNARYITIAAIRPLQVLVRRELKKYNQSINAPGNFLVEERRVNANQFVMRLIHNTEESHFFLPGEFFVDDIDRCVFLQLSIAIKAEHYPACLAAKTLQLSEGFSAKVGALAAGLYGQVATAALEEQVDVDYAQVIEAYKSRILDGDDSIWISKERARALKKSISTWKSSNPNSEITQEIVKELVNRVPNDQALLAARIRAIAVEAGINSEDQVTLVENKVAGDEIIRRFMRI